MRILDEHPIAKVLIAIITVAGAAIGIYQWGNNLVDSAKSAADPKIIVTELVNNEAFVKELSDALVRNEEFSQKLTGSRGPVGPIGLSSVGPIGSKGDAGERGPHGYPGKDGKSPSASEVAGQVIEKLKKSYEMQTALDKVKKVEKDNSSVMIEMGNTDFLLNKSLRISVVKTEEGKCAFQASFGAQSTGVISKFVGDSISLSALELHGLSLRLTAVNHYNYNKKCSFAVE